MQNQKTLEAQIKSSLSEAAVQVAASDLLEIRIRNRLKSRQIKEENKNAMKKIFTLKKIVVLAAIVCCLVTTVFASGVLPRFSGTSSNKPTYPSIPSAQQLVKDIGYAPKIMNAFSNGYVFKDATIVNSKAEEESGKTVVDYKELMSSYAAADGQKVELYANDSPVATGDKDKGMTTSYNGTDLKYMKQTYKFVPENYKLTADDQEAQADGSVVFSYDSDNGDTETEILQLVRWTQDGINYQFMTENAQLSEQNLLKMAQELIDLK